jgi:pSer/pThr/pTyr-binding forkhead associated (FHA) protein
MKATLCPIDGASPGAEIVLSRFPITLGRGTTADVRVADPTVSRVHCTIDFADGELIARNCSTINGTWVNEVPCQEARLLPGDLLSIGDVTFRVAYRLSWTRRIRTIWSKLRGHGKRAARCDRPATSAANGAGDLA